MLVHDTPKLNKFMCWDVQSHMTQILLPTASAVVGLPLLPFLRDNNFTQFPNIECLKMFLISLAELFIVSFFEIVIIDIR